VKVKDLYVCTNKLLSWARADRHGFWWVWTKYCAVLFLSFIWGASRRISSVSLALDLSSYLSGFLWDRILNYCNKCALDRCIGRLELPSLLMVHQSFRAALFQNQHGLRLKGSQQIQIESMQ
jgi:hypothetical protein